MKLIYLKSALKSDSFDISFSIEIPFFRVSFTIEPGRSLLQFVTTNCLIPRLLSALKVSYMFSRRNLNKKSIQQKDTLNKDTGEICLISVYIALINPELTCVQFLICLRLVKILHRAGVQVLRF